MINKWVLQLGAIGIVILFIWWRYSVLTTTIDTQQHQIEQYKAKLTIRDMLIKTHEETIVEYNETITEQNTKVENYIVELAKSNKIITEYASRPLEVREVIIEKMVEADGDKIAEGICEEGLKLNESIGRLRYEDL